MSEPASDAFYDRYAADVDALANRIIADIRPTKHAGGVLLLAATRMIGHLAGHLDNVRSLEGKERLGATGAMLDAYSLVNAGKPETH